LVKHKIKYQSHFVSLLGIRQEIAQIESGEYDRKNNPLKNAPHSQHILLHEKWILPYSLQKAVFPIVSRLIDFWGICFVFSFVEIRVTKLQILAVMWSSE
jgi:hypothetical protein